MDEAVVCPNCGCQTAQNENTNSSKDLDEAEVQKRKIKNKKTIIIVIASVCAAVALFFGSIAVVNLFRSNKILKELSGEKFEYSEITSYSIDRDRYSFDDEGNCEHYSYYYGVYTGDPLEYTSTWKCKIKFKINSAYVVLKNGDEFKIKYDEDGEIIGLYDSEKTYERK